MKVLLSLALAVGLLWYLRSQRQQQEELDQPDLVPRLKAVFKADVIRNREAA